MFADKWVQPGLSNPQSANLDILIDPYSFRIDAKVPKTNENELFLFFYNNRLSELPISNPWDRNLAKLIMLEVIVDVDLVKALIKAYDPMTHGFHRKDRSVLCTLDKETFIEAFELGGPLTKLIE